MPTTLQPEQDNPGVVTTLLVRLLATRPGALIARGLCALRYTARDGRRITLPVASIPDADRVLVVVGNAAAKTWWRHFRTHEQAADVTIGGRWTPCTGRVLEGQEQAAALAVHRKRHPRTPVTDSDEIVAFQPVEPASAAANTPETPSGVWLRWFAWVTLGEFTGFVAPAIVGAASTTWPLPATAAGLLLAGAAEGTALGWAQAHVLGRELPALRRARFVAATALAAVLAYTIGLVPMALGERLTTLPPALLITGGAMGGAVLLASIGTAQWLVLRRVRARCAWWIATTAGAWTAGLLVFTAVATPLWQPGQPLALTVAIGVLGGLAMAATVAALTGAAAVRLVTRRAGHRPAAGS
ncbi:hypothetical protein GCM10023215_29020 [Pseudonocardia yuanmonensis]|uniref:DUF385 domain-containing protein n=1 Tax=Pseudonocardia yuanmonensis TaxID=1095914 RepID=A0ABP8WLI2_9PSEU